MVWEGVPIPTDPAFPLQLHDNPASRTSVISVPRTVLFPNTAYSAKSLANQTSREEGQIPFPVKKFCAFPNPVLYFGHRVIKRSRKCQEEKLFLGLGEKRTVYGYLF